MLSNFLQPNYLVQVNRITLIIDGSIDNRWLHRAQTSLTLPQDRQYCLTMEDPNALVFAASSSIGPPMPCLFLFL